MASIRVKITAAYTGLLVGTVGAFGGALYLVREATALSEVAQTAAEHGDLAINLLVKARETEGLIITATDSIVGPVLNSRVRKLLDVVPEYVLIFDSLGASSRLLYRSPLVYQLSASELDQLVANSNLLTSPGPGIKFTLTRMSEGKITALDDVLLVERRPRDPSLGVARVVAGVSTRFLADRQQSLFLALLIIAPVILAVAVTGAHFIARRAFQPVDQIINEVEAITDGRSLHRRLQVEAGGDELARLSATLNAMIGRLETSFGALRRFTADASHELKTPLTVLRADVERAMHTSGTTEQLVALEEALAETTRMADLVDSLLTLARADEGRFDLHRERIDLEPLTRDVFETALILGEDAGITVTMPIVEGACVLGDRTRLRQLFLNLVTNAIKYTPRGGSVEITLARRAEGVTFAVRDTGVGIAAADLPHIFERFWRADRARSRRVAGGDGWRWVDERGGFGLGLAISQWIAQAHGGSLTAQSRLNRGSTFTVQLPIADDEPATDRAADEPHSSPAAL
jgi:signal transduction histidine kinase